MDRPRHFQLLIYMMAAAAAILVSSAFNIDVTKSEVHSGQQEDFFGYKVLQFRSSRSKGIIITAPLRLNGSGGVFRQAQNQSGEWFLPDATSETNSTAKHLGLSIAADPTGSQFTVCSPSLVHECHENSYLNSLCYNITDELQQISSFKPVFQECTKKTVNLVFLFDGSASMTTSEFNKNKVFIKDMMISLKNTSIKFAAVQFSKDIKKVFDFKDYDAGTAFQKLDDEKHMKSLTNTHSALEFVLKNLLKDPEAGASRDAIKVVVIITDGDPSDSDKGNIVKKYETERIIRVVIGVKDVNLEKFKPIASEPKDKNVFKIENYDGLTGILERFQNRIFTVEGSKVTRAGDLANEMSQSGFSSAFYKDTLILGSVGSNTWRGSLHELQEQGQKQISDPQMEMDSYMGYSLSVGEKNGVPLYFAGAPRFNHMGQVILFTQNDKEWSTAQRINEDQIGSYFGAELCSVDINADGDTDFLLVGAPLFYWPHENKEGRIYIYSLSDEIQLKSELNVMAPSMGRFGTTISSLSDLNGDGLRDVAVGAPLEDENRGAVYLFLGDESKGIRNTFSQRITGEQFKPELRFFGQAIDGTIDLGDDELTDIVVGSQGAVVVLRSKPVFNVTAHLLFHPGAISTEKIDCTGNSDLSLPMVNITACFKIAEATKSKAGAARSGLNISCTLNIDPTRKTNRGFFLQSEKKVRSFTVTHDLVDKEKCFNYSTFMQKCVIDTLSPINIKLNFSQADSENASAALNIDSKNQAVIEVPFERQCGENDVCISQLEVDFYFMSKTLLVTENNYINVSITLANRGDDSYNTSLTMHYPPGLSFSRMNVTESTRPILHNCLDLERVLDRTTCLVSRPVYRSKSSATFKSSFLIANDFDWSDTVSMTVTGNSDNLNSSKIISKNKRIPVQFQIRMALTVKEDTDTYLNFTNEDPTPQKLNIIYRIDNTGFKDFPVNVSMIFPTKLEHNFEVISYQVFVQENKTRCSGHSDQKHENCTAEKCVLIKCDGFILKKYSAVELSLVGQVQFKDLKQLASKISFFKHYTGDNGDVKFTSLLKVDYDHKRYVLFSQKHEKASFKPEENQKVGMWMDDDPTVKWTEVRVEFIILPDRLLIILTGVVLGLSLLIILTIIMYKMGCFKRKTVEYYQEQEDNKVSCENEKPMESAPGLSSGVMSVSETNKKTELPEEENLLDAEKTNGSPYESDSKKDLDSSEM